MSKIKRLNKYLIPKIAAGEVVDRPGSVVKELLDNAIDSGATEIIIEIKKAGKELIKVIDNGEGMDRDDLEKCFLPFTTSKISKVEDLNNITSMGFRGEALSSIASVARGSIKSKIKDNEQGNEIRITGGKKENIKPIGMNVGTVVEVEDLFFNVPSRKKFLKADHTEFKYILDVVTKYALSNWDKKIKLVHNNKVYLNLYKDKKLIHRIEKIFGKKKTESLIEIKNKNEYIKIHGYVGLPNITAYNTTECALFVNNRYIENRPINKVIKNSYGRLIESRTYPFFIIFLTMQPNLVNVNIHPQKKEVNFYNDEEINEFIKKNIHTELEKQVITYSTDYFGNDPGASTYQFNKLKEDTKGWNIKGIEEKEDYEEIFQIGNTYIVTHTKEWLVLVDQHSAHESILYEQYLDNYNREKENIETIETTHVIEFSTQASYQIEGSITLLNTQGFEIENFGGNTYKINTIPKLFKDHNIQNLIEEILENTQDTKHIDEKSKQTIQYLACRGAVKAGEKLTKDEMKNLLEKLEQSKGYLTCPHGRPTKILIPIRDMEKMFKRV